jgi:hypothetical protein
LGQPGMNSTFHRGWRVLALDGSVFEVPDTPANRVRFGSSSNQYGWRRSLPAVADPRLV